MFCDEFIFADLRLFENCQKVLKGCDHCFNLAADMGGMGFIQSNHSVIFYNNVMISFNMMEAMPRRRASPRCFYASSACIYPEGTQFTTEMHDGLKEASAWPAQPQDAYGLEKLASEEVYKHYQSDFGIQTRIASLPQHLRSVRHVEGRPRKGARRVLPQGRDGDDRG